MASQFSENTFYTNKGFSSYNGLLTTLSKNLSHGLQVRLQLHMVALDRQHVFDREYGRFGQRHRVHLHDAARPRECRGNSDFDETHVVNGDFTYDLPVGRGRTFAVYGAAMAG